MGKKEILLQYMRENKSITSFEAFEKLFDTRLSDTIYRLEKDGYIFERENICKEGYLGKKIHFYRYILLNPELEVSSEDNKAEESFEGNLDALTESGVYEITSSIKGELTVK
jgi:hypothetical protein